MGWESLIAPIAGAVLGGIGSSGSSTTTQTQNRDPWAPAQPWLIKNLGLGQNLQDQYMANPFSDAQKAAYGNSAALGNQFRSNLPGLFANMSQQSYTRQNPVASANPFNFTAPTSQGGGLLGGGGSSVSGAKYKPTAPVQGLIDTAQARAESGRGGGGYAPQSGGSGGTLPFDTGPLAALLGNLGLTGVSDFIASQNNGYGPLSGNDGYADPRDAAAKGLGVGNTAPTAGATGLTTGMGYPNMGPQPTSPMGLPNVGPQPAPAPAPVVQPTVAMGYNADGNLVPGGEFSMTPKGTLVYTGSAGTSSGASAADNYGAWSRGDSGGWGGATGGGADGGSASFGGNTGTRGGW